MRRSLLVTTFAFLLPLALRPVPVASAATEGVEALVASDFDFEFDAIEANGATRALSSFDADVHLNQLRCACRESLKVRAVLTTSGQTKLGTAEVDAALQWGADCSVANPAKPCLSLASSKMSAAAPKLEDKVEIAKLFGAATVAPDGCSGVESNLLAFWLILKIDGKRLAASPPSKSLRLDSTRPAAPKLIEALPGNGASKLNWTYGSSTNLSGYQVLCSPVPEGMPVQPLATCGDAQPAMGMQVCASVLSSSSKSYRLGDLKNGSEYKLALVAVDKSGNVSEPSTIFTVTPEPSLNFYELYKKEGGEATTGCSLSGARGSPTGWGGVLAAGLAFAACRKLKRRRFAGRSLLLGALAIYSIGPYSAARADAYGGVEQSLSSDVVDHGDSERGFNLSLGLGFYRPNIDDEFSGMENKMPFEKTFSADERALWQVRLERILWRKVGTLSLGLGAGHYRASGKALNQDLQTPSADDTALRVIPLSIDLGYQLDTLVDKGWGFMPYARAGFDNALWFVSDATSNVASGTTTGWHAALGLAFALDAVDPESGRQLDRETGVNHTLIFAELLQQNLTGLGSKPSFQLSDSMLCFGLILQM